MSVLTEKIHRILKRIEDGFVKTSSTIFVETQLIATGSTAARDSSLVKHISFEYVVALIDTNVIVRFEGRIGSGNWANLDADEVDTTITSNGTFLATFTGRLSEVRFTFVSESGGTAATIDVKIMIGN